MGEWMIYELQFDVPLLPPSVNHYWKPNARGGYHVSPTGKAFKAAIATFLRGRTVLEGLSEKEIARSQYSVEVYVTLGARARGDIDNMGKGILDGLKEAGCIHSDAAVTDLLMHVREERAADHSNTSVRVWRNN